MPPSPVVTHHTPLLLLCAGPRYLGGGGGCGGGVGVTREPGMGAIPPSGQVCSGSCHLLVVQTLSVLTFCDHSSSNCRQCVFRFMGLVVSSSPVKSAFPVYVTVWFPWWLVIALLCLQTDSRPILCHMLWLQCPQRENPGISTALWHCWFNNLKS